MSSISAWLSHFPYPEPREIQRQTLSLLADNWDKFDVFVIQAPTAFGKTAIARTLMNTLYSVSTITPTNMLVNQFLDEFPDTPTLHRLDSYHCEEWDRPCSVTRGKLMKFCKGCTCSGDLSTAKYKKGPGIYNYHTYLAHKLYRSVLVVDEAHNLLHTIRDRLALGIWQHDYRYPHNMWRPDQISEWIDSLPPNKQKHKKIELLRDAVTSDRPEYIVHRTKDWFAGKGTIRGEPEERDIIRLLPVDLTTAVPMFWPRDVEKIVLLSATLNRKDVEQLGLGGGRRRVCYIECKSPIPHRSRPIIIDPVVSVNRNNMNEAAVQLAEYIEERAQDHMGEKGVIHATYQMAGILAGHLTGPRYMFHTRDTKADVYREFRESRPSDGRILVACGMYEGIDLPQDLGRWQVISKIPWQSLGSPAVRYQADRDPEWFNWETWKTLIQACGRICRTPEDYGITYIPDGSIRRLWRESVNLTPEWWRDAVIWVP